MSVDRIVLLKSFDSFFQVIPTRMNRGVIIILTRIEYNVRVLFLLDVVVVSGKDDVQSHRRKQIGRVFWSKQGRFA
jgi:hypothetical protein